MSPRKKEDNEQIRELRRKSILEVSLKLFANRGYESTSISQIAKEAHISKGLVYTYFESKEELLKSLVFDLNSMERNFLEEIQDTDPRVMLQNIFTLYFKILKENKDQLRLISALTFQVEKFDFIQDLASQKMSAYLHLFEDLLVKVGIANAKDEAMLIGAMLDGISMQYLVIHQDYPLKDFEKILINKYCSSKKTS
jgi:AcrR family transcriptional regulator